MTACRSPIHGEAAMKPTYSGNEAVPSIPGWLLMRRKQRPKHTPFKNPGQLIKELEPLSKKSTSVIINK